MSEHVTPAPGPGTVVVIDHHGGNGGAHAAHGGAAGTPADYRNFVTGDYEPVLDRVQRPALVVGAVGLLLLVIGALIHGKLQFLQSYLYAFMFFVGIPLGCLGLLLIQHLTGGRWGFVVRRFAEAGARMLPVMALAFFPLWVMAKQLYPWAADDYHVQETFDFKAEWLSVGGWMVRALIYFAVWIGLALILNRWSAAEDRTGDRRFARRMEAIAGPGFVLFVLAVTFASFDWVMSLDPDWYSTMFGLLTVVGQGLSALAVFVLLLRFLGPRRPLSGVLVRSHFHDLGNLMLAATMLWAYMSFSQLLIIWSANIAEETPYYFLRLRTSWRWVGLFLLLFHFAIPFLLLLSRQTKKTALALSAVAVWMLFMRLVDLKWVTGPAFQYPIVHGTLHPDLIGDRVGASVHWMDIAALLCLGGLWLFWFARELKRRPLLAVNDYRLPDAIHLHNEGEHH